MDEVQRENVSVNFSHAVFSPLSTLADAGLGWLCVVWFRVVWFGAVQFVASDMNVRWPHIVKHQI